MKFGWARLPPSRPIIPIIPMGPIFMAGRGRLGRSLALPCTVGNLCLMPIRQDKGSGVSNFWRA